jgi:hypothetical protein
MLLALVGCLDMGKVDQAAHDEAGDILHTIHVECAERWFGEVPCRIYRQDFSPVDLCCTEDACRVLGASTRWHEEEPAHDCS